MTIWSWLSTISRTRLPVNWEKTGLILRQYYRTTKMMLRSEKSKGLRNFKSKWCSWATCAKCIRNGRRKSIRIYYTRPCLVRLFSHMYTVSKLKSCGRKWETLCAQKTFRHKMRKESHLTCRVTAILTQKLISLTLAHWAKLWTQKTC